MGRPSVYPNNPGLPAWFRQRMTAQLPAAMPQIDTTVDDDWWRNFATSRPAAYGSVAAATPQAPAWLSRMNPKLRYTAPPVDAEAPDTRITSGKLPGQQSIAAPGTTAQWEAPDWLAAPDTWLGGMERDVLRGIVNTGSAVGALDPIKAAESITSGFVLPATAGNALKLVGKKNIWEAPTEYASLGLGLLAGWKLPALTQGVLPVMNAPTQAIESALGQAYRTLPFTGGLLGRATEGIPDKEDWAEYKAGKIPLAVSEDVEAQQTVADFNRFFGSDFTQKYRTRKRGEFLGVDVESVVEGPVTQIVKNMLGQKREEATPEVWASRMTTPIAFSSRTDRSIATLRMAAGEDPDVVLRGYSLPANPSTDEQAQFNTRAAEYIASRERIAQYQASKNGATAKQIIDTVTQARAEAEEDVKNNYIPGQEDIGRELLGQTLIGLSPADPANYVNWSKLFGIGALQKLPVVGKTFKGLQRVTAPARELAEASAKLANQVYDETMARETEAALRGLPEETVARSEKLKTATAAATGGKKTLLTALNTVYQGYVKTREFLPETRARIKQGLTLEVFSALAQGVKGTEDFKVRLKLLRDNPSALVGVAGNVPVGRKAAMARDLIDNLLDERNFKKIEKMGWAQELDFNPARFIQDITPMMSALSYKMEGVPAVRKGLDKWGAWTKAIMGEAYLRNPSYIVRNGISDSVIMAWDGLATLDSMDYIRGVMDRAGVTPEITGGVMEAEGRGLADVATRAFGPNEQRGAVTRDGRELRGKSALSRIPIYGRFADAMGEANAVLEGTRRTRAYYKGFTDYMGKNWNPRTSDAFKAKYGQQFGEVIDGLERRWKSKMTYEDMKADVDDLFKSGHTGAAFSLNKWVTPGSLSAELQARTETAVRDAIMRGDKDGAYKAIDDALKLVEDTHKERMAQAGESINPTEEVGRWTKEQEDALYDEELRAMMDMGFSEVEAKANIEAMGANLRPDYSERTSRLREALIKRISQMSDATDADIDAIAAIFRHGLNTEFQLREEAYAVQRQRILKLFAEVKKIKASRDAPMKKDIVKQLWQQYYADMRATWDDTFARILGETAGDLQGYTGLSIALDDMLRAPTDAAKAAMRDKLTAEGKPAADADVVRAIRSSQFEAIKKELKMDSADDIATKAIEEAQRALSTGVYDKPFTQNLEANRLKYALARHETWRQGILIARGEPRIAVSVLQEIAQADADTIDNATATVHRTQRMRDVRDAARESGDGATVDSMTVEIEKAWTDHFKYTEYRYKVARAKMTAQQLWRSELVQALLQVDGWDEAAVKGLIDTWDDDTIRRITAIVNAGLSPEAAGRIDAAVKAAEPEKAPKATETEVAVPQKAEEPKSASGGIPMMVTRDMRQQLLDLGYSRAYIDVLSNSPAVAWEIIQAGTRAPDAPKQPGTSAPPAQQPTAIIASPFRDTLRQQIAESWRAAGGEMAPAQVDAVMAIFDARAEVFARQTNTTVDDWYKATIERVEAGPADGVALKRRSRQVMESPEFKEWFGESVVRDEDGTPKVVYHGTRVSDDFDVFNVDPFGAHFGSLTGAEGSLGAKRRTAFNGVDVVDNVPREGERVYPAYLRITNPLRVDGLTGWYLPMPVLDKLRDIGILSDSDYERLGALIYDGGRDAFFSELKNHLISLGYDGIVQKYHDGNDAYIAFDPNQIKSVIGNRGTFDPNEPSILKQGGTAARPPRGQTSFADDGRAVIRAVQAPDVTTALHEAGHIFRRDLYRAAAMPDVPNRQQLVADIAEMERFAEVTDGVWTRQAEEKVADAFETYLASGKAPTPGLARIFAQLREWFVAIYNRLTGDVKGAITPQMRGVFDRMLAMEPTPRPIPVDAGALLEGLPARGAGEPMAARVKGTPMLAAGPRVISFEQFAAGRGGSVRGATVGEFSRLPGASDTDRMRAANATVKASQDNQAKLDAARAEYDRLVASGEIRPPTPEEELRGAAAGMEDNESTQAARRVLEKRAAARAAVAEPVKPADLPVERAAAPVEPEVAEPAVAPEPQRVSWGQSISERPSQPPNSIVTDADIARGRDPETPREERLAIFERKRIEDAARNLRYRNRTTAKEVIDERLAQGYTFNRKRKALVLPDGKGGEDTTALKSKVELDYAQMASEELAAKVAAPAAPVEPVAQSVEEPVKAAEPEVVESAAAARAIVSDDEFRRLVNAEVERITPELRPSEMRNARIYAATTVLTKIAKDSGLAITEFDIRDALDSAMIRGEDLGPQAAGDAILKVLIGYADKVGRGYEGIDKAYSGRDMSTRDIESARAYVDAQDKRLKIASALGASDELVAGAEGRVNSLREKVQRAVDYTEAKAAQTRAVEAEAAQVEANLGAEYAEALKPIDEIKFNARDGWRGNVFHTGRKYASDGFVLGLYEEAAPKSRKYIERVDSSREYDTPERFKKFESQTDGMWKEKVKAAKTEARAAGQYTPYTVEAGRSGVERKPMSISMYAIVGKDKSVAYVNASIVKFIERVWGFDSIKIGGSKDAVVFYRDGKPVALAMQLVVDSMPGTAIDADAAYSKAWGKAPIATTKGGKRANLADRYANEMVEYGGQMMRRIDVIKDLKAQGVDQKQIDAYLMGMDQRAEMDKQAPRTLSQEAVEPGAPKAEAQNPAEELPAEVVEAEALAKRWSDEAKALRRAIRDRESRDPRAPTASLTGAFENASANAKAYGMQASAVRKKYGIKPPSERAKMAARPALPIEPPATKPAAPAGDVPDGTPIPYKRYYKTAQGSTYLIADDGTTVRYKTPHAGHAATDVGWKQQSQKTVYVSGKDAGRVGGHAGATGKWIVAVSGDQILLLRWNEKAGQWGMTEYDRANPITFTTEPEVGKSPVELMSRDSAEARYEAYQGVHAGNEITEIKDAGAAPAPKPAEPEAPTPESAAPKEPTEATDVPPEAYVEQQKAYEEGRANDDFNARQMYDAVYKQEKAALEAARAGLDADWASYTTIDAMPVEFRADLYKELAGLRGQQANTLDMAKTFAREMTNFALLDYGKKRGFDRYLSVLAPFSYWYTRQGVNFARRFASDPEALVAYLRYQAAMEKENKKRGTRGRFAGTFRIPGTEIYVDPLSAVVPFAPFFNTDFTDADAAQTWYQHAYTTARNVGVMANPLLDVALRASNALVDPMAQGDAREEQMRVYGSASISEVLPRITAPIQAATAAVGIGGPAGIDIESYARRALGMPAAEAWDSYRVNRSLADMAAQNEARLKAQGLEFDNLPYLLAGEIVTKYGRTGQWYDMLATMTAEQAMKEFNVDARTAATALELLREAAKRATQQRGFSQMASYFTGIRALERPEGEAIRDDLRRQEKAAAYSPVTGTGSLEDIAALREQYPSLAVQRAQYGALPGETRDTAYIYDSAQRSRINETYDTLRDAVIAERPWDKKMVSAIEQSRAAAIDTIRPSIDANLPAGVWEDEYKRLVANLSGGETGKPLVESTYYPRSIAGATPDEARTVRQNEAMRFIAATKPQYEDYKNAEGEPDYEAFNAAYAAWVKQLPNIAAGIPQVAQVIKQAGKDGVDLEGYLSSLSEKDVTDYYKRNDTPIEAAQRAYFEVVYRKAWDYYHKLVNAGTDKSEAYAASVGAVGELGADKLALVVKRAYGNRWSDEELTAALGNMKMPALEEVYRSNMSDAAKRKSVGQTDFWQTYNTVVPPGRASSTLKDNPLVALVLDRDARGTATAEQYEMAAAIMRTWVKDNLGDVTPQMQAEFQAVRQLQQLLDAQIQQRFGPEATQAMNIYYSLPDATAKKIFRLKYPQVMLALLYKQAYARKYPLYALYYGANKVT